MKIIRYKREVVGFGVYRYKPIHEVLSKCKKVSSKGKIQHYRLCKFKIFGPLVYEDWVNRKDIVEFIEGEEFYDCPVKGDNSDE